MASQIGAQNRILPQIVEQHAENASFLWLLRDRAVDGPDYDLADLATLEDRLEANLDGLRIAGPSGADFARQSIRNQPEVGEFFVAALLAIERWQGNLPDEFFETATNDGEADRGLRGAIGWAPTAILKSMVSSWIQSDQPYLRYLAVVACSLHRADPGPRLQALLSDPDQRVRSRSARLTGELGRVELAEQLRGADEAERWAAWSRGLLGDRSAIEPLKNLTEIGWYPAQEVAIRLMSIDAARAWSRNLIQQPEQVPTAIRGLGILGDPQAVRWLLERMDDDDDARQAGESFCLITGADLDEDHLASAVEQDGEDDELQAPADEQRGYETDSLSTPDRHACELWWSTSAAGLVPGQRYLLGAPTSSDSRHSVADRSPSLRQRRSMAYEIAIGGVAERLPNWRRRAHEQGGTG